MAVDFTPTMQEYSGQGKFRYWVQMVLPTIYDDSLSYMELLNKVVYAINLAIEDIGAVEDNVTALLTSFEQLQQYTNDYFDNLDVQQEIDNKLDQMVEDGTLTGILSPIINTMVPPIITNWLDNNIEPTTPPVDKTLSVEDAAADALTTGGLIRPLNNIIINEIKPLLIYGTITSTTGQSTAAGTSSDIQNRIRTAGKIKNLTRILNPNGYSFSLFFYNDDTFISTTGFKTDSDYFVPNPPNCNSVRIVFTNNDTTTPLTINEVLENVKIFAEGVYDTRGITVASGTGVITEAISGNTLETRIAHTKFIDLSKNACLYGNTRMYGFFVFYYDQNLNFVKTTGVIYNKDFYKFDVNTGYAVVVFLRKDNAQQTTYYTYDYKILDTYESDIYFSNTKGNYTYYGSKLFPVNKFTTQKTSIQNVGYAQDGEVYNGDLIRLTSRGDVYIYDMVTGEVKYSTSISENIPHANSVFLGDKYDPTDLYPMIYANLYNNQPLTRGVLYAYRPVITEGVLTLQVIRKFIIGFTDTDLWTTGNDDRPYGNFLNNNGELWAYTTLDGDVNKTRFFNFGLLANYTDSEVTLTTNDIVKYFDTEKQSYPQGCSAKYGIALCSYGWQGDLVAVNLESGQTITRFNLRNTDVAGEPELVDILDDGTIIYNSASINVYKLYL